MALVDLIPISTVTDRDITVVKLRQGEKDQ
jgi:hypothetical protein